MEYFSCSIKHCYITSKHPLYDSWSNFLKIAFSISWGWLSMKDKTFKWLYGSSTEGTLPEQTPPLSHDPFKSNSGIQKGWDEKCLSWCLALECQWLHLIAVFRHPVRRRRKRAIGRKASDAGALGKCDIYFKCEKNVILNYHNNIYSVTIATASAICAVTK